MILIASTMSFFSFFRFFDAGFYGFALVLVLAAEVRDLRKPSRHLLQQGASGIDGQTVFKFGWILLDYSVFSGDSAEDEKFRGADDFLRAVRIREAPPRTPCVRSVAARRRASPPDTDRS